MMPLLSTLPRPQRIGYILSSLFLASGWLFLLAVTLEWTFFDWSGPALALQALALIIAFLVLPRTPPHRLIVYSLTLAVSIYLLDTTLPPPNFPSGWPREIIPRLVLMGLFVDCTRAMRLRRRHDRGTTQLGLHRVALEDAAQVLGLTVPELRVRLQQHRFGVITNAAGQEYLFVAQLYKLRRRRKPPWWQLYGWVLLMSGVLLLLIRLVISAGWEMVVQGAWCVLTLGGMWIWVRIHRDVLRDEDRAKQREQQRNKNAAPAEGARTIPLTPVQERFLAVMKRQQNQEE